jgi:pyruvate carboxylase subunit B
MIDENTWGMMLGKSGSLPGKLDPSLIEMAKQQNREFFTGNPQDLYPDVLPEFAQKMKEKGWDEGKDQEELFEYAMHPKQYEDYKSGKARENYLADLQKRKDAANASSGSTLTAVPTSAASIHPKSLIIEVNGEKFNVNIEYPKDGAPTSAQSSDSTKNAPTAPVSNEGKYITSPLEGKFFLTKNSSEKAIAVGDTVKVGDTVAYVESMKVINAITSSIRGTVQEILVGHGDDIEEDAPLIKIA